MARKKTHAPSAWDHLRDWGEDVNWRLVGIVAVAMAAILGAAGYALQDGSDKLTKIGGDPDVRLSAIRVPKVDYTPAPEPPPPAPPPPPRTEPAAFVIPPPPPTEPEPEPEPEPVKEEPETEVIVRTVVRDAGEPPRDDLLENAKDSGIGEIDFDDEEDEGASESESDVTEERVAALAGDGRSVRRVGRSDGGLTEDDGTEFEASGLCQVKAGTVLPVKLQSAVNTGHGGKVTVMVDKHVYASDDPDCIPIPFGSTLVGEIKRADMRGQRTAIMEFYELTRPYPKNDTIQIKENGSDGMGRNGAPGEVVSHFWSQAALIAVSSVLDIGSIVVAGEGPWGVLGGILGRNSERPISKAAKDRLDIPPSIIVDPLERNGNLTVILSRAINADDYRL